MRSEMYEGPDFLEIIEYSDDGAVLRRTYMEKGVSNEEMRDFHGRWTSGGRLPTKMLAALQGKARKKYEDAPVPSKEDAVEASRRMDEVGADRYEANIRGNSKDREASRKRLLQEFGDGHTCGCVYCGLKLDESTVTRDKMYTARQGGKYRHSNLIPACLSCNQSRSDTPFEEVKWRAQPR